mgnify:CR=1 FL=1
MSSNNLHVNAVHINAVHELRREQLVTSTREFKARGATLKRCPECLLAESKCICNEFEAMDSHIGVCMLMYHAEYYKPSNTGQLICHLVKDNFAFRWERTSVEPRLEQLIQDPKWYPVIIFPHDNVEPERQLSALPEPQVLDGKRPLFIFLDGTWRQAKKMFIKSPYLQALPVLQLEEASKGSYQLRVAHHEHHMSTVEVAFELFKQNGEARLGETLEQLFEKFRAGYQAFKR